MKIAFIASFFGINIGGAEKSIGILANLLRDNNVDVTIFTTRGYSGDNNVININRTSWLPNKILILGNKILDLFLYHEIKRTIKYNGPFDLIHIQDLYLLPACTKIIEELNIPAVVTIRDKLPKEIYEGDYNFFFTYLGRIILKSRNHVWIDNLKKFKHIIVTSNFIKNELLKLSIDKNNISIIPNPCPLWENGGKVIDSTDKKFLKIFSAGSLFKGKGFDILIKAVAKIKNKQNIKLLIAGDGPYKKNLVKLIKSLNLNKVFLLGKIPFIEMQELYFTSDIVVFPAIYPESFGRIALEGMMAGKPVIASNVGGIPDVVENNKTGILVSPNNVDKLTEALERLINNQELRLKMGRMGKKRAEEKFDPQTIAKQHINLYQSVIKEE